MLGQQKGCTVFWVHWSRNDMPVVFSFPAVGFFFFFKLNLELVGVGVLISMCTACTSHTRTLCRIVGREITACVKEKIV